MQAEMSVISFSLRRALHQRARPGEMSYDIQAAAFAYAYYLVDNNPYIDAFILNRQVDAVIEVEQSCSFGLWTVDMSSPDRVIAVMPKNITTYSNILIQINL